MDQPVSAQLTIHYETDDVDHHTRIVQTIIDINDTDNSFTLQQPLLRSMSTNLAQCVSNEDADSYTETDGFMSSCTHSHSHLHSHSHIHSHSMPSLPVVEFRRASESTICSIKHSMTCNKHHHRRNSIAIKFDKPVYKRMVSQ